MRVCEGRRLSARNGRRLPFPLGPPRHSLSRKDGSGMTSVSLRQRSVRRSPLATMFAACLGVGLAVAPGCGCRRQRPLDQSAKQPTQPTAPQPLPMRDIPILCMHDVGPNAKNAYSVRTADLEKYLKWLSDQGYQTVTVRDVAAFLDRQGPLPDKPIVLCFDDNWKSALKVVQPMLNKYGFVGVAFVMTDNLGMGERKLSWQDCKALAAAGWEIGSHTRSHENLTRVARGKAPDSIHPMVEDQIRGSKAAIEGKAGVEATSLALPYGNYDTFVLETAKDAGYTAAVSIDKGVADEQSDPFLLPRRMVVNGTSFATFQRLCTTRTLHVKALDPPPGTRVIAAVQTITGVLGDADVMAAPLGEVQGKPATVSFDAASRRITLKAELNRGANSIALAASGREVSWLLIRDG